MADFADALAKDRPFDSSTSLPALRLTKGRFVLLLCVMACVTEVLLAVRFVVQFTGMGWSLVVLLTEPLVAPFRSFEPSTTEKTTGVFEFATVLAAEAYLLAFVLILTLAAGLPLLCLLAKAVYFTLCEVGRISLAASAVAWRGACLTARWSWRRYCLAAYWMEREARVLATRAASGARTGAAASRRRAAIGVASAIRGYDDACLRLEAALARTWRLGLEAARSARPAAGEWARRGGRLGIRAGAVLRRTGKSLAEAGFEGLRWIFRRYDAAALWTEAAVWRVLMRPRSLLRRVHARRWASAGQGGGPRLGE